MVRTEHRSSALTFSLVDRSRRLLNTISATTKHFRYQNLRQSSCSLKNYTNYLIVLSIDLG
jgi:hypothetical protein